MGSLDCCGKTISGLPRLMTNCSIIVEASDKNNGGQVTGSGNERILCCQLTRKRRQLMYTFVGTTDIRTSGVLRVYAKPQLSCT